MSLLFGSAGPASGCGLHRLAGGPSVQCIYTTVDTAAVQSFYLTLQNVWDSRHPRLRRISEGLAEAIRIVSLSLMGNWQTEKDDGIRVVPAWKP